MNPILALVIGVIIGTFLGTGAMAMMSVQGYEDGYRQAIMDMKHNQKR